MFWAPILRAIVDGGGGGGYEKHKKKSIDYVWPTGVGWEASVMQQLKHVQR